MSISVSAVTRCLTSMHTLHYAGHPDLRSQFYLLTLLSAGAVSTRRKMARAEHVMLLISSTRTAIPKSTYNDFVTILVISLLLDMSAWKRNFTYISNLLVVVCRFFVVSQQNINFYIEIHLLWISHKLDIVVAPSIWKSGWRGIVIWTGTIAFVQLKPELDLSDKVKSKNSYSSQKSPFHTISVPIC